LTPSRISVSPGHHALHDDPVDARRGGPPAHLVEHLLERLPHRPGVPAPEANTSDVDLVRDVRRVDLEDAGRAFSGRPTFRATMGFPSSLARRAA
jgi:hypothetical protein